jgi:hypothetical protein
VAESVAEAEAEVHHLTEDIVVAAEAEAHHNFHLRTKCTLPDLVVEQLNMI